ncbi:hypothetical protein [Lentzea sp.]|uniref:ATP-grasp domain-containing protein n=1 Tax=Lentzea sp. TaxID=56099 RepID=UPI002BFDAB9C|nr:hypothetical protein [Lentzea sp.]HUQ59590.1 hypothetical protein [Lentzea sp.]
MPDAGAPPPGEFRFPGQVVDVRPRKARATGGAAGSRRRPRPAVLLLSRACDEELGDVQALLATAGIPVVRVNADELADARLVIDAAAGTVRTDSGWSAPTVSWTRHFSCQAIEGTGDPGDDLFLRESWHAAAAALAALGAADVAPPPGGLLAQLRIARLHRVRVPRTIVTTDLAGARDAFQCRRLVVKAVHRHFTEATPGCLTGRFPAVVERRELLGGSRAGPPVIVQEHVEHDAELRIYYLDGRIHGFEITKESPADPWLAPGRVGVRMVTPSSAVAAATRLLATAMSLRYGAFDFLVRGGTPIFLEVNPDGDWRWAERGAGTGVVTLGVAAMLADLHREAAPADRAPPFDLLTFLSGHRGRHQS